ncbi:MAG: signal peptidase II [Eubacterium sp.]|nr:signal peptidase II [Eubacterium sp.]
MKLKNKNIWSVVMIIAIIAIDQVTKYFAKSALYPDGDKDFIKGFIEFRYAENTGMAFSMFSGARWFFVVLTAVVTVGMAVYMFKKCQQNLWLYWTIGVLISGAVGNLIDRICYGYVIDFINPTFVDFAIFNIADCAVTLGAVSLVAYLVFDMFKKDNKESKNE